MLPVQPSSRTAACNLCGDSGFSRIADRDRRGDTLYTVLCKTCGLVSHEQIPSQQELAEYYGERYREDYHGESTPSARRVLREWRRGQSIYAMLQPYIRPEDRVFEVGAGIGCNIKQFELAGHAAAAIEPGRGFQTFSREQLRAPVTCGFLEDVPATPSYELVLLVHVLEHLPSPKDALDRIQRMLVPGGQLYVEVPNFNAPHSVPRRLFHYAHLYNFTPATLKMLANASGFRVERMLSDSRGKNLQMLLRRSPMAFLRVDPGSYRLSIDALTRYNALTYHLRRQYVSERMRTLYAHLAGAIGARARLGRILRQCQETTPVVDTRRVA